MNILVISQYFYPETFRVNTLCEELVKRGNSVTVLTGYPQYPQGKIYDGYGFSVPYEKEWNGVKIERIKMRPRGKTPIGLLLNCYSFVREGKKWVKKCKEKFDVVYVFEVSPVTVGLPAIEYKKKFNAPICFNVQDLWPENVEIVLGIKNKLIIGTINKIVDKIYSASDRILCSSNSFVENISKRGVSKDKLVFWPQFCNEPNFENMTKPACYSDDFFNVVFAGNIGEAQGLDLLVKTALKLKDTNVRWYIVGDGRARQALEKHVVDNGLSDVVFFVGRVSEEEANEYIYYADLAYLSFMKNKLFDMTLPAKLQSYMVCSTPILAAVSGESAFVVNTANCGFVCERDDIVLSETIKQEVLPSKSLKQMGENGKKYFDENFKKDVVIDNLEKIMRDCIRESNGK
jgi:glycosyltransferase involved in cell wall biosynthesis